MDKKQQEIYDNLLLSVLFELDKYPKKSGQEGTAYFIDDNFVVKEILGEDSGALGYDGFEVYCQELAHFHKKGYAVPEIYSWAMLPKSFFEKSRFNRFYVLEERIPGRRLFLETISHSYELCEDICSKEEYEAAILSKEGNLYKEMVQRYLNDYIERNEQIESMSSKNLENFILSDYNMTKNHTNGMVDLHAGNVLFDGKKMTIIDNGFMENFLGRAKDSVVRQGVMRDMLRLMSGNSNGLYYGEYLSNKIEGVSELYLKHKKLAFVNAEKFIKKTNELLSPVFYGTNNFDYANSRDFIRSIANNEDEKKLISMLQRGE